MIFLRTQAPALSGLGQDVLAIDLCTPVNVLLAPLGPVKSLVTTAGCCTDTGKKALDAAIAKAIKGLPASPYKDLIASAAGATIRGCLCKSTSCAGADGGGGDDGKKSNTALYVALGVGVLALAGVFAVTRKKK